MNLVLALVGASGLVLLVSGIPRRRTPSLRERTQPYVAGMATRTKASPDRLGARVERALSILSIETQEDMRGRLEAAGRDPSVGAFRAEQVLWGIAGVGTGMAVLTIAALWGLPIVPWAIPVLMGIALVTGILARDWWLGRQMNARRLAIEEEMAVGLELAAMAVMAGESIPASLARSGAMLPGPFGDEIRRMSADIRGGSSSADALEGLRRRCDLGSIDRFVQAVLIALERGTPLVEVLRAQVDDAREARRRRLMESAGRREVLMLVPVVFILMPTVILFALYPALVSLELVTP